MAKCETCKFWGRGKTAEELGAKWGECSVLGDEENEFVAVLGYDEDSWLDRGIETQEEFGCILHKEKGEDDGK